MDKNKFVGRKAIAVFNKMKIKVTVVAEITSHNKFKLYCKPDSDAISGKIMVPFEQVVFIEDFDE